MPVVGGELVCYCGRCKLSLAHTILAMVDGAVAQVRCNTCSNVHANQRRRGREGSAPRASGSKKRSGGAIPSAGAYEAKLKLLEGKLPIPYSMAHPFQPDDIVDHPTFGRGVVLRTEPPDKMEVLFRSTTKLLAHNRSA